MNIIEESSNNKIINNESNIKDKENELYSINLNDKYGFQKSIINFSDIKFNKDLYKINYNKIDYFKTALDYKNVRYFNCINYHKKSKHNIGYKMCKAKN